jgi:hypothetical protein
MSTASREAFPTVHLTSPKMTEEDLAQFENA